MIVRLVGRAQGPFGVPCGAHRMSTASKLDRLWSDEGTARCLPPEITTQRATAAAHGRPTTWVAPVKPTVGRCPPWDPGVGFGDGDTASS